VIISIIVAILFGSTFAMPTVLSAQVENIKEYSLTTEQQVNLYFFDIPIMKDIAFCESRMRQFNSSGEILRGEENRDDVGVMQINKYYHGKTADKKNIDLHTVAGNMAYARYLYEKNGTSDWNASKPCWSKRV